MPQLLFHNPRFAVVLCDCGCDGAAKVPHGGMADKIYIQGHGPASYPGYPLYLFEAEATQEDIDAEWNRFIEPTHSQGDSKLEPEYRPWWFADPDGTPVETSPGDFEDDGDRTTEPLHRFNLIDDEGD